MKLLALDIGGTFIKRGVVDSDKTFFAYEKVPAIETLKQAVDVVVDFLNLASKEHKIEGIAISMYGIISPQESSQSWSKDLWYHNVSYGKEIQKVVNLPVHIINDGHASLVGAIWRGEANKNDDTIAMTIGTGIGGAFWINGKLALGVDGAAGQLGDILTYNPETDSVENYARQHSTARAFRDYKEVTGIDIEPAKLHASMNDGTAPKEAKIRYENWISRIGVYFASIVNVFNPKTLLVSGGVFENKGFFERVMIAFNKHNIAFDYKLTTEIKIMKYVSNGNLFGAAYNFFIKENTKNVAE